MKIISICNQKGGVGKTTTAITLASFLALNGKKTLLVDLDPQGNSTSGLGIDKRNLETSIYNVLMDPSKILSAILPTQVANLSILPSNINLTGAEIELVNEIGRETRLKKALSQVQNDFEFGIIDCPPSLALLTINALTVSQSVIVPMQCEFYAMEGLGQLMKTIDLVRDNLNENLKIEGILMTMADHRANLTEQVIKEVRSHLGDKVYNTVIPRSIKMGEAPGFGKPIMLYDKNCSACKKYEEFTIEFLGKNNIQLPHNRLGGMLHGA
jgi:chromosome partitioning protein